MSGKQPPAWPIYRRLLGYTRPYWPFLAAALVGIRDLGALVALEQRVALQLLLDEGGDLEVRGLQQLDGLPQLRRHHQRLRLAKVEART